jgi:hypothetical protein
LERPRRVAHGSLFPDKPHSTGRREGTDLVTDDQALAFIHLHLKSVWGLELLLLFHNNPEREWRRDALVRELRGSEAVVNEALSQLKNAGVVIETSERLFRFASEDPSLRGMVAKIAEVYSTHPVAVIKAISGSPSDKLKIFSDAFKIRDT